MLAVMLGWSCKKDEDRAPPAPGAASQSEPQAVAPPGADVPAQQRAACPLAVEDVQVAVTDTDDGVALVLTSARGDIGALRERVRHLAQIYELHRGYGHMMWYHMHGPRGGGMGPGFGPGMMAYGGPMPAVHARIEDIAQGARLILTPVAPTQLATLREQVRQHQQWMHSGACWWLQQRTGAEQSNEE